MPPCAHTPPLRRLFRKRGIDADSCGPTSTSQADFSLSFAAITATNPGMMIFRWLTRLLMPSSVIAPPSLVRVELIRCPGSQHRGALRIDYDDDAGTRLASDVAFYGIVGSEKFVVSNTGDSAVGSRTSYTPGLTWIGSADRYRCFSESSTARSVPPDLPGPTPRSPHISHVGSRLGNRLSLVRIDREGDHRVAQPPAAFFSASRRAMVSACSVSANAAPSNPITHQGHPPPPPAGQLAERLQIAGNHRQRALAVFAKSAIFSQLFASAA